MGPSKYIQSQFYTPGLLPFEGDLFTLFCAFALNARSGKVTQKTKLGLGELHLGPRFNLPSAAHRSDSQPENKYLFTNVHTHC